MALVTCSGCGRLVSDKVETCIYCGKNIAKKSNYALDLDLNYIHSLVKNKNGIVDEYLTEKENEYMILYNTGVMALKGVNGCSQSYERAFKIFEYLSKNYPTKAALFNLGEMYENGEYVSVDYERAYELYLKCATEKFPGDVVWESEIMEKNLRAMVGQAKFRMGELLISRKVKIEGLDDNDYYWWGFECYLAAAEDDDPAGTAYLKSFGKINAEGVSADDEWLLCCDPYPILQKAKNNDVDAIVSMLTVYYYSRCPYFNRQAVKKWAELGYSLGSEVCMLSYVSAVLCEDSDQYQAMPEKYDVFILKGTDRELIKNLLGYSPILRERLVVHSLKNIEKVLDIIQKYYDKSKEDIETLATFAKRYINFVNEANSYERVKEGLPSGDMPVPPVTAIDRIYDLVLEYGSKATSYSQLIAIIRDLSPDAETKRLTSISKNLLLNIICFSVDKSICEEEIIAAIYDETGFSHNICSYIFKEWKEIINEQFIDAIKTHLIDCEGVVE